MTPDPAAPTRDGAREGREPSSGIAWAVEIPDAHCAEHDGRQVRYWRSRPPEERLARAAHYRFLRHGPIPEPTAWTWRFVSALESAGRGQGPSGSSGQRPVAIGARHDTARPAG